MINRDIKGVQKKCLEALDAFIELCEQYKLSWFIDSGTLLGYIRNGKLIEWDDDIDIAMPRRDFNKFIRLGNKLPSEYFLQTPETDNWFNMHAKIRVNNTTFMAQREYQNMYHRGIAIDIFPLDSMPKDEDCLKSTTYFLRALQKHSVARNAGCHAHFQGRVYAPGAFRLANAYLTDVDILNRDSDYLMSSAFIYANKYMNHKLLRKDYSEYTLGTLEGLSHKVRVPIGHDDILRVWYGDDYMTPRQEPAGHEVKSGKSIHDCDKDYTEYDKMSKEKFDNLFTFKAK